MMKTIHNNTIGYLLHEIIKLRWENVEEGKVMDHVLEVFRKKRKGLTSVEIKERGLNVYSKRGISFFELVKIAEERGLITREINVREDEREIVILKGTKKGKDFLRRFYTDNYSNEFIEFNNQVSVLFEKYGELELAPNQIEYLFWRGDYPVSEIERTYLNNQYDKEHENHVVEFHEYLSGIKVENLKDDEFVFHFSPKLFLPDDWFYAPVSLEIEGVEIVKPLVLNRPYPNHRYIVAGFDKDNGIVSHGFYWIKSKEELLNNPVEITLNWLVGNKKITHKIDLEFQFGKHNGKLFSNAQSLTRNTKLKQFEIKTDISKVDIHEDKFMFYDQEVLTNFPVEKHSYFDADRNMDRWESKKRKERVKQKKITEVYYNIISSAKLNWEENNQKIIKEYMRKGEENFCDHGGDYGVCLSIDYKKDISAEVNEDWIIDTILELAKRYKITEFELWKKYGWDDIYEIGLGIYLEGPLDSPTIKIREVYLGWLEDWNFFWDN
ncbi:DUF5514 family protein [Bacillus anthracis]|uniref:DUF5514 family protein n=1 Tax=Bacillus anthracis TaxID=1392 RepID=UPI002DB71398|nr:DUF5514 family protein [Bacillus anthracis]MEB9507588.1 DUF5514 family protein [Bacillus anthracis]